MTTISPKYRIDLWARSITAYIPEASMEFDGVSVIARPRTHDSADGLASDDLLRERSQKIRFAAAHALRIASPRPLCAAGQTSCRTTAVARKHSFSFAPVLASNVFSALPAAFESRKSLIAQEKFRSVQRRRRTDLAIARSVLPATAMKSGLVMNSHTFGGR